MGSKSLGSGFIYGLKFQNAISPLMRETIKFHDTNIMVLMVMGCLVGGMMYILWSNSYSSLDFMDSKILEVGWTMLPVFMLVTLALPSLELLFYLDCPHSVDPMAELNMTGLQWYWHYSVSGPGPKDITYDSYMMKGEESDDKSGFRLLEVDNPLFAPRGQLVGLKVSGGDVIHSFAIPSLGMKMDGVPGRVNEGYLMALKLGSYYGQCSEICGANHSFMPMNLEMIPAKVFAEAFQ